MSHNHCNIRSLVQLTNEYKYDILLIDGYNAKSKHFSPNNNIPSSKMLSEFMVTSKFKKGTTARKRENVVARFGYTVEHDNVNKGFQLSYVTEKLGELVTVSVDSGNKSIHHHIITTDDIKPSSIEDKRIRKHLLMLFPFCDQGVLKDCAKLVRNPNGFRKASTDKKITKDTIQAVQWVGKSSSVSKVLTKLEKLTTGLKLPKIVELKKGDSANKKSTKLTDNIASLIKSGYDIDGRYILACLTDIATAHNLDLDASIDAARSKPTPAKKSPKKSTKKQKPTPVIAETPTNSHSVDSYQGWLNRELQNKDVLDYANQQPESLTENDAERCYSCRCPMPGHDDNNPSAYFSVNDNGVQIFACDGCGEICDAVGYLVKVDNLSFKDAHLKLTGYSFKDKCNHCDNPVLFDPTNRCYSLDKKPHRCKTRETQQLLTPPTVSPPMSQQQPISMINFIEPATDNYQEIHHMAEHIRGLESKKLFLFSAPTGTGKTHMLADEIIRMYKDTCPVITILTNSIKSVDNFIEKIEAAAKLQKMPPWLDITRNVTDRSQDHYDPCRVGQIAVATYHSLGRKGHTDIEKLGAHELIKGRIVICDEIQALIEFSKIHLPLSARYKLNGSTYLKANKCPVKNNNPGACNTCMMAYRRRSPDKFRKLEHVREFEQEAVEMYTREEHMTEKFEALWDVSTYENDEGVFNKFLDENIDYELTEPREVDDSKEKELLFAEYIESLLTKLKYPQLSMVSPINKSDNTAMLLGSVIAIEPSDRKSQVRFPEQACQVPHLKGIDIMPLLQILQAEKVVMCSATIPEETMELLEDVIIKKDWSMKVETVDKVNVTYNAVFLTTTKTLSRDTLTKVCQDMKHESLVLMRTMEECVRVYNGVGGNDIEMYRSGDFEDSRRLRKGNTSEDKRITAAYLRSPLATGLDFPDKLVLVVDCQGFYPQIVCTKRNRAERLAEMNKQATRLVIQAVGRLLRTNEDGRNNGFDDRSIVVLLHGLDYEIEIDKSLFHSIRLINDDRFITRTKTYAAVTGAIDEAVRRVDITDYRSAEKQKHADESRQLYLSLGRRGLSKKQRNNVDLSADDKRMIDLTEKAKTHTGAWREFARTHNVSRLPKRHQKKLMQLITM